MKLLAAGCLVLGLAPFQCASEPAPSLAREDAPAEALMLLAAEFDKDGDSEARLRTLRFVCARYPKSRFAAEADVTLSELGAGGCEAAQASAAASASPSSSVTTPSVPSAKASASAAPGASAKAP